MQFWGIELGASHNYSTANLLLELIGKNNQFPVGTILGNSRNHYFKDGHIWKG
jgi:hypothetical protein